MLSVKICVELIRTFKFTKNKILEIFLHIHYLEFSKQFPEIDKNKLIGQKKV